MRDFLTRNLTAVLGVMTAIILGLGIMVVVLLARVSEVENEVAALRTDIERVESGTAVFAAQITAFQQQLTDLAPTVGGALDEAVAGLETFRSSTLDFEVPINEIVVIDTEVVLERTITVPVNTEIPISDVIETTITIDGPLGVEIPLDVTVPVDVVVPVNLDLDFPISERVPVQAEVPVDLNVPITIDIAGTELAGLAESLQQGLLGFQQVIEGLG